MDIRPYIKSEALGYWYLRLNGFLTIQDFVVHPERGYGQETDVDIIGVRFPYRAENLDDPMEDDKRISYEGKPLIVIAEVKNGRCSLNGPWTNPERRNMLRVLRSIGALTQTEADIAARSLYSSGVYSTELYHISLLCLGGYSNPEITEKYPLVPQILWDEVLRFIFSRFKKYERPKTSHPQWDVAGQFLWNTFMQNRRSEQQFLVHTHGR